MKKPWIVVIIVLVSIIALAALAFLGLYVYDVFFYDDYYYDDEYSDDDSYYDDDEDYYDDEDSYDEDDEDYYDDEDSDYEEDDEDYSEDSDDEDTSTRSVTPSDTLANLIILINFTDQDLSTDESDWADFYFGSGNSVASYYDDMSKGKFAIVAASESYGTKNDGIIVVDVSDRHPNLTSESEDEDYEAMTQIFEDALAEADQYIDYSQYDANNDGEVLAAELSITLIAAGYEENEYSYDENQVAGICINEDYFVEFDNSYLGDYILCGELEMLENGRSEMVTIGVACHELGHVLGLPDLYDTDYSSIGLGFHSLMSEGNNNRKEGERLGSTPSPLIAWSREYVGFIDPQTITKDGTYTLYGQSTDDYNVIKIEEGNGYYLIENVDFGGYGAGIEEYMDHSGIAIWYINEDVMTEDNIWNNEVNDNDRSRGVILIEASGNDDLYEESLDYDNPDYDHYFAKGYVDEYVTDEGTVITVIDKPGKEMQVEITLGN